MRLAGPSYGLCAEKVGSRELTLTASVQVGQRERVVIVDTPDARLVLGVTAQQITHLHTLPPGSPDVDTAERQHRRIFVSYYRIWLNVPEKTHDASTAPSSAAAVAGTGCSRPVTRPGKPAISQWWPELVTSGTNAGIYYLVDVSAGHSVNDDQLHPHHYCFWSAA